MAKLKWDQPGEKLYETGVEKGVLFPVDAKGNYPKGVAWNGLSSVTESPSGAEATAVYADNKKYLNLVSAEELGGTIEAYMFPDEFAVCDGSKELAPGVYAGQQNRKAFGLAYMTLLGNDTLGTDYGYKLHIIYNALASPSEKAYSTVNDSPEAMTLSWEFNTTPVESGIDNVKVLSSITVDSTKFTETTKANLAELEKALFGDAEFDPFLPTPEQIVALLDGSKKAAELAPKDDEQIAG
ncbi:MAG: hypothetical protein KBT06_03450 [Prevotellaceae bacterium]|nr:hypothetical protein [Candidatus Colivivens equi]